MSFAAEEKVLHRFLLLNTLMSKYFVARLQVLTQVHMSSSKKMTLEAGREFPQSDAGCRGIIAVNIWTSISYLLPRFLNEMRDICPAVTIVDC